MDQAIEETDNRAIKAPGGAKGFCAISELRNMTDVNKSSFYHLDLSRSEDLKDQRK